MDIRAHTFRRQTCRGLDRDLWQIAHFRRDKGGIIAAELSDSMRPKSGDSTLSLTLFETGLGGKISCVSPRFAARG